MIARLVAALLVIGILLPAPASAESRIVVSADGRTWTAALAAPVFDPAERWVPGDVRTGSFYVRNQASAAGTLGVVATARDAGGLLSNADLLLQVRRAGGSWADLPADGQSHPLDELGSSASTRIEVRATFDPASPNRSQARALDLGLRVVLSQVTAPTHGGSGGSGGTLPDTGGPGLRALVAGVALMTTGFGLLLINRRKERSDQDEH